MVDAAAGGTARRAARAAAVLPNRINRGICLKRIAAASSYRRTGRAADCPAVKGLAARRGKRTARQRKRLACIHLECRHCAGAAVGVETDGIRIRVRCALCLPYGADNCILTEFIGVPRVHPGYLARYRLDLPAVKFHAGRCGEAKVLRLRHNQLAFGIGHPNVICTEPLFRGKGELEYLFTGHTPERINPMVVSLRNNRILGNFNPAVGLAVLSGAPAEEIMPGPCGGRQIAVSLAGCNVL